MKCFIVCVCLAVFAAVHAKPTAEEAVLLKRLVRLLEGENTEKRYFYSTPKTKPGQVWVDLQSVVEVENACPDCRLFVAHRCISSECHNKAVTFFPQAGYSWAQFKTVFIDGGKGVWIDGLENGMEYELWDVVKKANGDVYPGYNNTDKKKVTIPSK